MKYDLHIHSIMSDGKVSRNKIVEKAIQDDLQYIAFTEHNDYYPFSIGNNIKSDLVVLKGIEFDTFHNISFHTLCYFKELNQDINKLINKFHQNTNDRSEMLIKNISKLHNIKLSLGQLQVFFNKKYITKRDIIDWLILNNYSKTVDEASYKFTGKTAISYVPKFSLDFKDVVDAFESDGEILLAHPSTLRYNKEEQLKFIKELIDLGLNGIEVINTSKMTFNQTEFYESIAKDYRLLTCGGSDFHDFNSQCLGVEGDEIKKLIKLLK